MSAPLEDLGSLFSLMTRLETESPETILEEASERWRQNFEQRTSHIISNLYERCRVSAAMQEKWLQGAQAMDIIEGARETIEKQTQLVHSLEGKNIALVSVVNQAQQVQEEKRETQRRLTHSLQGLQAQLLNIPSEVSWINRRDLATRGRDLCNYLGERR